MSDIDAEGAGSGRVTRSPRLDAALRRGPPALICYLPLGDPLMPGSLPEILAEAGADVLEVGVPARDPLLDGPVIADSMRRARAEVVGPDRASELLALLRSRMESVPLVWMGYPEGIGTAWAGLVAASGVDAVLLADAPRRLADARRLLAEVAVPLLSFLDLTLDPADLEVAAKATAGYAMVQAVQGRTGVRLDGPDPRLERSLSLLRRAGVHVPLAVGFGVAGPAAARKLVDLGADAVIVGSAVVTAALEGPEAVAGLVSGLRRAVDAASRPEGERRLDGSRRHRGRNRGRNRGGDDR